MKLALLGYGKMGKEIEQVALERGHHAVLIIDIANLEELTTENLQKADVAVDFSTPGSAINNIHACFKAGIPLVSGTTGWHDKLPEITELCRTMGQSLFHSSNYSIGVNILFAVNEYMANLMDNFSQYDVTIEEIHHTQKLDAPSGTAISLAGQILSRLQRKKSYILGESGNKEDLSIKAIREGDVKGIHEICYDSGIDFISLKHTARSRRGFAEGAVLAAEYIKDKKGVFTMRDILGI